MVRSRSPAHSCYSFGACVVACPRVGRRERCISLALRVSGRGGRPSGYPWEVSMRGRPWPARRWISRISVAHQALEARVCSRLATRSARGSCRGLQNRLGGPNRRAEHRPSPNPERSCSGTNPAIKRRAGHVRPHHPHPSERYPQTHPNCSSAGVAGDPCSVDLRRALGNHFFVYLRAPFQASTIRRSPMVGSIEASEHF